jgi:hypothetical protein
MNPLYIRDLLTPRVTLLNYSKSQPLILIVINGCD